MRIKGIHRRYARGERGSEERRRRRGEGVSSGAFQAHSDEAMHDVVRHAHRQTVRRPDEPFLNQANAF